MLVRIRYTSSKLKIISANNTVTKIQGISNDNDIIVFPNPAKNSFNVLLSNLKKGSLQLVLYNASGQIVWEKSNENFTGADLINVAIGHLSSGIYWLSIKKDDDPAIVRRILKST